MYCKQKGTNFHNYIHLLKDFCSTARYTIFDHIRNEEILEELKVEPVDERLRRYKPNWLRHATRMNKKRKTGCPKIMMNYRPNERRRLVRPLKGLLDEAETGL